MYVTLKFLLEKFSIHRDFREDQIIKKLTEIQKIQDRNEKKKTKISGEKLGTPCFQKTAEQPCDWQNPQWKKVNH